MRPSDMCARLRSVAASLDGARRPSRRRTAAALSRLAEAVPPTQRSPRLEDWEEVDLDFDSDEAPRTRRSPDLEVRSKQFISDMEAGVDALDDIVKGGVEGREADIRKELEAIEGGVRGIEGLLGSEGPGSSAVGS